MIVNDLLNKHVSPDLPDMFKRLTTYVLIFVVFADVDTTCRPEIRWTQGGVSFKVYIFLLFLLKAFGQLLVSLV